jgi:hypothetical protein
MGIWTYIGLSESGGDLIYQFVRHSQFLSDIAVSAGYRVAVTAGDFNAGTVLVSLDNWVVSADTTLFQWANRALRQSGNNYFYFRNWPFTYEALVASGHTGWYLNNAFILVQNAPSNNNIQWVITNVETVGRAQVADSGFNTVTTSPLPVTAIVEIRFLDCDYELPLQLVPWALFIKCHAARAIRAARAQDTSDLDKQLAAQHMRVVKASANRTEDVTQAPFLRRRRGWSGGYSGG